MFLSPLPFALMVMVVAGGVIFLVWMMMRKRRLQGSALREVKTAWKRVQSTSSTELQVIEADKVLDLALRKLGFEGSLGEKLKKAGPRFSHLNDVWNAHKLRNAIAHETNAHVSSSDAARAIKIFHRALQDLGMP